MRKYIVIDCCENETGASEIFNTIDEAEIHLFIKWCRNCPRFDEKEHPLNIHNWIDLAKIVIELIHSNIINEANNYIFDSAWCTTDSNCYWRGRIIKIEI